MHAIILVMDEADQAKVAVKSRFRRWLYKWILNWPLKETKECFYLRNCFINAAKKLIKYLRKDLSFTKEQIIFLRSSRFKNANELLAELKRLFLLYKSEDLLFYYAGHGNEETWGSGKWRRSFSLKFTNLAKIFKLLEGKLIFIVETCQALAIESHLRRTVGKYLLFGSSRRNYLGCGDYLILNFILDCWRRRKIAYPVVAKKLMCGKDITDIPAGCSYLGSKLSPCICSVEKIKASFTYSPKKRPSLRRGGRLDRLCYPR